MKRRMFLLVVIFIISAISGLMSLWLTEDSYSIASRLFTYYSHKDYYKGKGPAPNQYRYLPYLLVEKVFKHIPINWRNDSHRLLVRWLGRSDNKAEIEETRRNYDAFIPMQERAEIAENIKDYMKKAIANYLTNPIFTMVLSGFIEKLDFEKWIEDPAAFFSSIIDQLPEDFKAVFEEDSEISRIVNAYATFRFTFTFLSLVLLYIWLKKFLKDSEVIACIFIFGFFYLYSMRYFTQSEAPLALSFFLSILLLVYERRSWITIALLVAVGSFARSDHMLFATFIYALYNFGWSLKDFFSKQTLKSVILISIPVSVTYLLVKFIFPNAHYYSKVWHIRENFSDPWMWIGFALFAAIPLFFADTIRRVDFFKRTYLWLIPFFVMNLCLARIAEVRLFLPAFVYLLPIVGMGMRFLFEQN